MPVDAPVAVVPVSVRFEPVVAAMGSGGGAAFWRVARRKMTTPAIASTEPPITTSNNEFMAREATRSPGLAARWGAQTGDPAYADADAPRPGSLHRRPARRVSLRGAASRATGGKIAGRASPPSRAQHLDQRSGAGRAAGPCPGAGESRARLAAA